MLHDGAHEAIVSEEDWQLAHQQRLITGVKQEKTHSLEHEHILSGILKCPVCGGGMYGNVNRKKKKDGSMYRDYFYYACKHRLHIDGKRCDYHKQWDEDIVNDAVADVIRRLVRTTQFETAIREKIGRRIDTTELEKKLELKRKKLRQLTGTKDRLGQQIDQLDFDDSHYNRKYQDLQERQNTIYDEIVITEADIADVQVRLNNIRQQKISEDNVYQFLLYFDKLYDKFSDAEKKEFISSFIESVEIYPEKLPNGRFLKRIEFRFPVFFNGQQVDMLSWDAEGTVESSGFF